jgi:hypothetical protein
VIVDRKAGKSRDVRLRIGEFSGTNFQANFMQSFEHVPVKVAADIKRIIDHLPKSYCGACTTPSLHATPSRDVDGMVQTKRRDSSHRVAMMEFRPNAIGPPSPDL